MSLLPREVFKVVKELANAERATVDQHGKPNGQCGPSSVRLAQNLAERGVTVWYVNGSILIDEYKLIKEKKIKVGSCLSIHCFVYLPDFNVVVDCTGDQFNQQLSEANQIPKVYIASPEQAWRYIFTPYSNFNLVKYEAKRKIKDDGTE